MTSRLLTLDPFKCNGCKECEVACAVKNTGLNDPGLSRIRITTDDQVVGFFFPVVCLQCTDPPCMAVCPAEAITRDLEKGVTIRMDRCVGCKMCIAACPFGAMFFDHDRGRPLKCDLCGGDPACVRRCEPGALCFSTTEEMSMPRVRAFARNFAAESTRFTG